MLSPYVFFSSFYRQNYLIPMPGSIYPASIPSFPPLSPIFEGEIPGGRFRESSIYNHVVFSSHAVLFIPFSIASSSPLSPIFPSSLCLCLFTPREKSHGMGPWKAVERIIRKDRTEDKGQQFKGQGQCQQNLSLLCPISPPCPYPCPSWPSLAAESH